MHRPMHLATRIWITDADCSGVSRRGRRRSMERFMVQAARMSAAWGWMPRITACVSTVTRRERQCFKNVGMLACPIVRFCMASLTLPAYHVNPTPCIQGLAGRTVLIKSLPCCVSQQIGTGHLRKPRNLSQRSDPGQQGGNGNRLVERNNPAIHTPYRFPKNGNIV